MNTKKPFFLLLAASAILLVTISCSFASDLLSGDTGSGASLPSVATLTPTLSPTETPPPAPTGSQGEQEPASPAPEQQGSIPLPEACFTDACIVDGVFVLARPIGPEGRNQVDYTSRFGEYRSTTRDSNHGVSFLNSQGTPVLAAADGEVVVAGDDSKRAYGSARNFYGNLVILQHEFPGISQPVFTLYSQLSEVAVQVGDQVQKGLEIGKVGMTGRVTGSTLHFEVRLGENSFVTVRNPELWLESLPDDADQLQGALAGRIVDEDGNFIAIKNITVEQLGGPGMPAIDQFYLKTYAERQLGGLEPWYENFAISDLPAGEYQISFWLDGMQQREVEVQPGKLTLVTFIIK